MAELKLGPPGNPNFEIRTLSAIAGYFCSRRLRYTPASPEAVLQEQIENLCLISRIITHTRPAILSEVPSRNWPCFSCGWEPRRLAGPPRISRSWRTNL